MPIGDPLLPWFSKGTYTFNGQKWDKLNDILRQRKTGIIGAQTIEIEKASSVKNTPTSRTGFQISFVEIIPSNQKSNFSGFAAFWVDIAKSGYVWAGIFRDDILVGLVAEYVEAGRPHTMSISFFDLPAWAEQLKYVLRVYTESIGDLYINKCNMFAFDGSSQTAFIVAENT